MMSQVPRFLRGQSEMIQCLASGISCEALQNQLPKRTRHLKATPHVRLECAAPHINVLSQSKT